MLSIVSRLPTDTLSMSNLSQIPLSPPKEQVDLSEDQQKLFDKVPADGSSIGNKSLRQALQWEDKHYWVIRNSLVERDFISTGQGRGGSVYRLLYIIDSVDAATPGLHSLTVMPREGFQHERDLYKPVGDALEKWAKELQFTNYFIEDTSTQGSRKTGGVWTRPDLVMVNVETYQYVPNKYLELITFEVKPSWSWDISAVFETAAHSKFSSRSYLAIHRDREKNPITTELEDRIEEECKRFGVGLIVFDNPEDYDTYEFRVDPMRKIYDPREVEKFMEQVTPQNRARLSRWLR